ncbi:hypothetical protein I3843_05G224700 [Carya illinoinensis]|nr:hypothetical protein I3843_05G224700 [Carya illinoinensis]
MPSSPISSEAISHCPSHCSRFLISQLSSISPPRSTISPPTSSSPSPITHPWLAISQPSLNDFSTNVVVDRFDFPPVARDFLVAAHHFPAVARDFSNLLSPCDFRTCPHVRHLRLIRLLFLFIYELFVYCRL